MSQAYANHVLDATDAFSHYASLDELAGVPPDVVQAARAAAQAEGKDGHKLTLHFPCYFPVLQHGTHRPLRERLFTAFVTRASELGPPERDNSAVMRELLQLRREEAQLLGYANFAEVSLAPKMAGSPDEVTQFLRDLARRVRAAAENDLAELRTFAAAELGLTDLQAWDIALRQRKAQRGPIRLQRPGGQALLPAAPGAAGSAQHH